MKYLFELALVDKNGRKKKSIFLNDHFLNHFEPSEDRMSNCIFCTRWTEDRKDELRKYFKGLTGFLCLSILDISKGVYIAGSDFIGG